MKLRQERFYRWLLWGVGAFEWQERGGRGKASKAAYQQVAAA